MKFELFFTNKAITPWGGMLFLKQQTGSWGNIRLGENTGSEAEILFCKQFRRTTMILFQDINTHRIVQKRLQTSQKPATKRGELFEASRFIEVSV